MNKLARFHAAVAGDPVDRAPRTCWAHYMTETLGGDEHAQRHITYQNEYDWDILKVVNDFHYPFPDGVETINGPEDMEKFQVASMSEYHFAEELICLKRLRQIYGPQTPIVFTTFDPIRQVVRRAGASVLPTLLAHPQETLRMLRAVSETMCTFMGALREAGLDGMFLSINSGNLPPSPLASDDDVYETFLRPFEIEMLEAMSGMVRMVHLHGAPLTLERSRDYPFEVLSVSDRSPGNPSLKEAYEQTGKCMIGGISESKIADMKPDELRAEIADAKAQLGQKHQIIAPGCTIPIWTPAHLLHILADTSN